MQQLAICYETWKTVDSLKISDFSLQLSRNFSGIFPEFFRNFSGKIPASYFSGKVTTLSSANCAGFEKVPHGIIEKLFNSDVQ